MTELLGFWTLSIIWDQNLEYDVSETGSVSILRSREEDAYSVGSLRKN
jgi:hypothetical protein